MIENKEKTDKQNLNLDNQKKDMFVDNIEHIEEIHFDLSDIKLDKKEEAVKLQESKTEPKVSKKIEEKKETTQKEEESLNIKEVQSAVNKIEQPNNTYVNLDLDLNIKNNDIEDESNNKSRFEDIKSNIKIPSFDKEKLTDFFKSDAESVNKEDEDIKYVNSLYNVANEEIPSKVNTLFILLVSVIVLLILWANIAQIDELTRGEGKVIPSSKIQTVQSFDGGIVSEILIKEGQYIKKDQPLMKIDTTRFQATFEENQENLLAMKVKKVRLEKELITDYSKRYKELNFSTKLKRSAQAYIKNQTKTFKSKFLERRNTLKIIELQYQQKQQELTEAQAKEKQLKRSLNLMKDELKTIERLTKSGSKSKVELINIKKEYNTLEGDLESVTLSLPRIKLSIAESKAQIEEKLQSFRSNISQELETTINEIKKTEAKMVSESDKLEKTVIKSPVTGTIKQININTIGSVVQSGANLIEIVPDSDILLVEAKIDPKDIAFINPNSKVMIKLTAYDFSIYGGLDGKIIEISADSIKDQDSKDNKSYYKVVVKTEKNYLEHNNEKLTIIPGMIASVDIITGKKSIMDFFLKPILKVKEGAFHER